MLNAAVAALACLCLARTSPAEPYNLRLYSQNFHTNNKDISTVLANIEERLRVLDTVSAVQAKQSRRLDDIQDKLDRVETTLTLKLERAQLAAERLEHRLHMLQTNVQASIKESSDTIERSEAKITELAQNLTNHIKAHKTLLEKVNGAYADTWHRGLVLEALMRDGLSLVNVTRRELADGLRALARRHRDAKMNSAEMTNFARRLNDNTNKLDLKVQEVLDTQKRFVDSCQRDQQDDPNRVAKSLDKLLDSLVNKIGLIFRELKTIQGAVRDHDATVKTVINTVRPAADAAPCHRLESAFRNQSHGIFRETELKQLTEKFVALTDRADAALQRLESQLGDEIDEPIPKSEVDEVADELMLKLKGIKDEKDSSEEFISWEEDAPVFEDGGAEDIMEEDKKVLLDAARERQRSDTTARPSHRRHLHKHPYDRGPKLKPSNN